MTLRVKLMIAFGIAFLTLCGVGLLSYQWTVREDEDQRWVVHTHTVLEKLGVLQADVISAEAELGNYTVTSEASHLSAYEADTTHLQDDLNEVGRLTSDNPRQQQSLGQLRALIPAELPELAVDIQGFSAVETAKLHARERQESFEHVRTHVGGMEDEERRLLGQRLEVAKAGSRRIKLIILFGNLLAVLFLSLGGYAIQQEMGKRSKTEEQLRQSEERFRLMTSSVKEYAILLLDPSGHVTTWNAGAERIKGYRTEEIIGQHFSRFYPTEDVARGKPDYELKVVAKEGQLEDEGWRVRKDGSKFWANVVITAIRDQAGRLRGFSKVTRDMTERRQAEEAIKRQNAQLEAANRELDAFSYSVAHDLRAPLRAIEGFSLAVLQDYKDQLPDEGKGYLERVRSGALRMAELIDDLLKLARISRQQIQHSELDLSWLAEEVASQFRASDAARQVRFLITPGILVTGDRNLLRIVLENLLGNAWKFTSKTVDARIELGIQNGGGNRVVFIRDNGPGFDMKYADKLFGVFQRLHRDAEFPGTGVGLATVQRIIHRHGGRIWAEAAPGKGATFYFVV